MKKVFLFLYFCFVTTFLSAQCAIGEEGFVQPGSNLYLPGDTVSFCYTVSGYMQTCSNWFHGVTLNFGPGWDTSTLTIDSLPSSCDGNGAWGFYFSDSAIGSGVVFGPGFYYDSQTGGTFDSIPGNNYGDYNITNCSWTFCFSLQVGGTASSGYDLWISATPTGDGASGSWGPNLCCSDSSFYIVNYLPLGGCVFNDSIITQNAICFNGNGCAAVMPLNGSAPYSYSWSNGFTGDSIQCLQAGTYTVQTVDVSACVAVDTFTISQPSPLIADAGVDTTVCQGLYYQIGGSPSGAGGTPPYSYAWQELFSVPDPNPFIETLNSTTYHLMVTDSNGCVSTDSVLISVVVCSGVQEINTAHVKNIFPNPSKGLFSVEADEAVQLISVYDMLGRKISERKPEGERFTIDLSNFPDGMYQLRLVYPDGYNMCKLIKL